MSSKTYLIDGSGYIFRAYYGIQQELTNSEGLPTNALLGFSRMLIKLIKEIANSHEVLPSITVIFDAARKNFRHDIYPEYKANRAECPEDLIPQMPYFRKIADALGFEVLEKEGFEADDVIASLVSRMPDKEIIIVSADKDLTQLVGKNVTMWDPMRDRVFDEKKVKEHFGVNATQIRDYLSLIGDASDNIPGVKGLGPKTAAKLFERFPTLEDMLANPQEILSISGLRGAKGVFEKIESNLDLIRLSQKLVSLDMNCPIENEPSRWIGPRDQIGPLFSDLGFKSLLSELSNLISIGGGASNETNPVAPRNKDYQNLTPGELKTLFSPNFHSDFFGFDTETDSLNPLQATLVGISFSYKEHSGYYFSVIEDGAFSEERFLVAKNVLEPILNNPKITKCGSNLKYDIRILNNHGIKCCGPFFDTMIASHLQAPDRRENGLKKLSLKYLNEEMLEYKEMLEGKESILDVDSATLANYAAHDADAALRVSMHLLELISPEPNIYGNSQKDLVEKVEMPLIPVLAEMEDTGIFIDSKRLVELREALVSDLEQLSAQIIEYAGREFNVKSPKQLAEILFDELGISTAGVKKTKSGYSTDASVLSNLQDEHPIISLLLEYRELSKLLSTYVESLSRLADPVTNRIHASFNQAITATGRLSSSDPNLQNIPIRTERGRQVREVFIAAPEHKFVFADYSQIELRVLAHLSDDDAMCEAFRSGKDIHRQTAVQLFGLEMVEADPELRRIAKTINFGVIYGMGPFRLAKDLGVSRRDASTFIEKYFDQYPKVRGYFDGLEERLKEYGYVETLFGRRRFSKDLEAIGRDKGYVLRSLLNAPIQGTAAEIVKLAMIKLSNLARKEQKDQNYHPKLVLQVHDELVFEVPKDYAEKWGDILTHSMEQAIQLKVPLVADLTIAHRWGK